MQGWMIQSGLDKGCLKTITIGGSLLVVAPGICTSFCRNRDRKKGCMPVDDRSRDALQAGSMAMNGSNGTRHGRKRQPLQ